MERGRETKGYEGDGDGDNDKDQRLFVAEWRVKNKGSRVTNYRQTPSTTTTTRRLRMQSTIDEQDSWSGVLSSFLRS